MRARRSPVVLIVDDDDTYRHAVSEILKYEGYETHDSGSIEGALALLRKKIPDVIVSDTLRSEIDGATMLQAIQADDRFRDIPVITASANAMVSDKAAAFASGASGFLAKPFSAVDLLAEVGLQLVRTGLLVKVEEAVL